MISNVEIVLFFSFFPLIDEFIVSVEEFRCVRELNSSCTSCIFVAFEWI